MAQWVLLRTSQENAGTAYPRCPEARRPAISILPDSLMTAVLLAATASITKKPMVVAKTSERLAEGFCGYLGDDQRTPSKSKKKSSPDFSMRPLLTVIVIAAAFCVSTWIASLVSGDTSW